MHFTAKQQAYISSHYKITHKARETQANIDGRRYRSTFSSVNVGLCIAAFSEKNDFTRRQTYIVLCFHRQQTRTKQSFDAK